MINILCNQAILNRFIRSFQLCVDWLLRVTTFVLYSNALDIIPTTASTLQQTGRKDESKRGEVPTKTGSLH